MKTALAVGAALVLLASCGTETGVSGDEPGASPSPVPTRMPTSVSPPTSEVVAVGTVLDDDRPELCLGGVAESLPPQCEGVPISGWDWSAVVGHFEDHAGVRWGEFTLVGTFDSATFTPTAPARPGRPPAESEQPPTTTCPEPDGGWRVVDPATTTEESMYRTFARARSLGGYAGAFVDQSLNPAYPDGDPELMNDLTLTIVNVLVTGDVVAAEAELRKTWGGSLCVAHGVTTEEERQAIQQEVNRLPGMLGSAAGLEVVEVGVVYDDGSLQAWADRTFGEGLVEVTSALTPAP